MLLKGKRLVVTGVLTDASIGFAVAERALAEGAEIVLTSFGRAHRITERTAKRLPVDDPPPVLELDVNQPKDIEALAASLTERWGTVDGLVHAVAFAPEDALGGGFLDTPPESAELAFRTSAYSLKALTAGLLPLLEEDGGGAVVGLDFDATVAWPAYDWMGVAKAALESVNRYLARDLGPRKVRCNLVAAGPIRSLAAGSIPGFQVLADAWAAQAPLAWDPRDATPVADAALFLLSDRARAITGEILHVDGGYHALGAPLAPPSQDG
ncbi:MAG: meromycolic acid enoyl-[acyl-carrier-protein] reductase [Solirubrobacteraceae bacterium]|jgi:enoyl-[acyl-carrier protein] reductase I|nr:meromycolic acid enoyl-[acyl-carrier-protein] reductase [Solirubrobacteraceae bacterium]